jgi:hypothetical protein
MRSLRTILNTPIRIPGLKPHPKVKRAPWVLRRCPENKRKVAVLLFSFAGAMALLVVLMVGLMGIVLAPLLVAAQHPDAPIAFPVRWLISHFSRDTAILIYAIISVAVAWLVVYLIIVFDYLRYDASERQKRDAAQQNRCTE